MCSAWLAQAELFLVWPNNMHDRSLQASQLISSNGLYLSKKIASSAHVLGCWLDSPVSVTDHFLALIFQTNLVGKGKRVDHPTRVPAEPATWNIKETGAEWVRDTCPLAPPGEVT